VTVEGHTDSRGADAMNLELSQKRAEAVRDYLVSRGVAASTVTALGKGEQMPLADNDSTDGRATNRRVEIVVAKQPSPAIDSGAAQLSNPGQAHPVSSVSSR
jgi:outer membrane protein OmpA-like peptidoglycan-associated protein